MAKRKSLAADLRVGQVDDDELRIVLSSVLPRGAQFQPGEVEYRTMADEWALSLQYREGKIAEALAGPALTAELEDQLRAAVDEAFSEPAVARVCRWTLFCSRPVEGHWRHRDQLQIVPAPPEAPRPPYLMAEHPFVLDFAYRDSTNWEIRQHRYARRALELMHVLNLLLRWHITSSSNRGRKHWIWSPEGPGNPCIWAQEGYIIPEFQFIVDSLPAADTLALEQFSADTYYDRRAGYSDVLTIPVELSRLLDAFSALDSNERERFLRACYWYHTASKVWDLSQSLHLTSLIHAIECLATVGPERSKAEGPSVLFLGFMAKFAPGGPSKTQLNKIYDVRGEVTHGERLLHLDRAVPTGLDQTSAKDREVSDAASLLCKGALINWLWSHGPDSAGPLLTKGLPITKAPRPGTKSKVIVTIPNANNTSDDQD